MSAQRKWVEQLVSETAYFRMAEQSEVRLEYIAGIVRAMAGTTRVHANIASRVLVALSSQLRDGPCEVVASDLRVKAEQSQRYYYPDIAVYCEDARFDEVAPDTLLNPIVLVEVLSRSTSSIDRSEKLDAYRQIPSLRHYLLIEQNRVRIEHYRRVENSEWHFESYLWRRDLIQFPDLSISIAVDEVYRRLNLPEGLLLLTEENDEAERTT